MLRKISLALLASIALCLTGRASASLFPAPRNLHVTGFGQPQGGHNGYCVLSWSPVAGADHYVIYGCDVNGGGWTRAGQVNSGTSSSASCPPSVTVHYLVVAEDFAESDYEPPSNIITASLSLIPNPGQNNADPVDKPCSNGGPSCGDPVNLATGAESYEPAADISVYNPSGPAVVFARSFRSERAEWGQSSPGLSPG